MTASDSIPDLRGLLPSWELAMKAAGLAESSRKLYMRGMVAYLDFIENKGETPTLARQQVTIYLAMSMEELGRGKSTMKSYLKGVQSFARWATEENELDARDLAGLKPPKPGKPLRKMMENDDHERILATCELTTFGGCRDYALLRLMADAGPRAHEVLRLKVADLAVFKGHAPIHGKGDKGRYIAFSDATALALDRYLRRRRTHPHAARPDLWLGIKGPTFGYSGLNFMIKKRAALAGVDHATAHMWRRLFAHNWMDRGGSSDGLKAIAGWTSDAMVAHYTEEYQMQRALKEARKLFDEEKGS